LEEVKTKGNGGAVISSGNYNEKNINYTIYEQVFKTQIDYILLLIPELKI